MEKRELLLTIRDLISDAEPEQALDLLEKEWAERPQYKVLLREVISIAALFRKSSSDMSLGIISYEDAQLNFNRGNNRLLNVLEYFERDNLEPEELKNQAPEATKTKRWWWLLVIPIFFLIVIFLKPDLLNGGTANGESKMSCPTFEQTGMKILVLPFYKVNPEAGQPEGLFAEKLESFCSRCNLNISVRMNEGFKPTKLLNYEEASRLANSCNADIIFWGRTEFAEGRNIIKTRYKFAGTGANEIPLSKLEWGEQQFDTVNVLSEIADDGFYTANLQELILLAVGASTMKDGNMVGSACLLTSLTSRDTAVMVMRSMLIAENFLKSGNPDKALMVYDSLLKIAPDNWLAHNNRGMLLLRDGNSLQAINDFSDVLQKREDPAVLFARAKAYQSSEQLTKAASDFEKVAKVSPELKQSAQSQLEQTNQKIELEKGLLRQTPSLPENQFNSNKYISQVDAYSKLGENQKAFKLIEKGLEQTPYDPRLTSKKIELLLKDNREEEAQEALKAARERGVTMDELSRHSELVARYIKNLQNRQRLLGTYKRFN